MGRAARAFPTAVLGAWLSLSCSGSSSTTGPADDGPRMEVSETEHFVFHVPAGNTVDTEWQESYVEWLTEELAFDLDRKIHYYKYRNRGELERATGMASTNAFASPQTWSIHTIDRRDSHEIVHVIAYYSLGEAPSLFGEGIAVAYQTDPAAGDLETRWSGERVHSIARRAHRADEIPALEEIVEHAGFRTFDTSFLYPLAGSFVRYLIDERGLPPLRAYFGRSDWTDPAAKTRADFLSAYGEPLDVAWTRWRAFLDGG